MSTPSSPRDLARPWHDADGLLLGVVEVHGHGVPAAVRGDLVVEDDVLHFNMAQPFDRVGYSPEKRWHVVLTWALGIGLAEVPDRR